jgi:phage gp45-like
VSPGEIARLLDPVRRRVLLAIGRALLRGVDDAGGLQRMQVSLLGPETRDAVERVQPYGLTSVPLVGAEAVVVCVGGNRDHPVVVACDDPRLRPSGLQPGEVCVYGPEGQRILMKGDGTIEIEATRLVIRPTDRVRIEGLLEVTGDVTSGGISLQHHAHTGVEPGSGTSGPPAGGGP